MSLHIRARGEELVVDSGRSRGSGLLFELKGSNNSCIEDDHRTTNTDSSSVATIQHSNVSTTGRAMAEYNQAKRLIDAYLAQNCSLALLEHLLEDGLFVLVMRGAIHGLNSNITDEQIRQIGQEYVRSHPLMGAPSVQEDSVSALTDELPAETGPGSHTAATAAGNDVASAAGNDCDSSSHSALLESIGEFSFTSRSCSLEVDDSVQDLEPIRVLSGNATIISSPEETLVAENSNSLLQEQNNDEDGEGTTTSTGSQDDRKPAAVVANADGEDTTTTGSEEDQKPTAVVDNVDSNNEAATAEEDHSTRVAKKKRST